MPDAPHSAQRSNDYEPDWWSRRVGGRGVLQLAFGSDIQSILLIATLAMCFVIVGHQHYETLGSFVYFQYSLLVAYVIERIVSAIPFWRRAAGRRNQL